MQWDYRQIRRNAWSTAFRRGWRAWLKLVAVCFIFAFIGATNASQATFVDGIDRLIGASDVLQPHNMAVLDSYLERFPLISELYANSPQLGEDIINGITETSSWAIHLLALNPRYFADNPEEVAVTITIVALISLFLRFFVLNVIAVGQHRFVMETRFARDVAWRRMLSPFHLSTLLNMLKVMVCYHVSIILWSLTIVGGFYKGYQYRMVPYLLAENPQIGWREARRLSMRMTNGYKMKMFLTQLSYLPVMLLRLVPVLGMLVAVPLGEELSAEFYFTLRAHAVRDDDPLTARAFVERAFDGAPYVLLSPDEQQAADAQPPVYLLQDLDLESRQPVAGPLPYAVVDLVYMFFLFCFIGWVWEVGLHFFQMHEFANRGTLHGPWIPIYGFGGAGIILLLDRFKQSPTKLFALAVGLCAVLEYLTSFILDFMFNASYWNYDNMLFNVNGRICLAGLVAFGIGGLIGVYVAAPAVSRNVNKLPVRTRYTGAGVLLLAFLGDVGYCLVNGFNTGSGVGEDL